MAYIPPHKRHLKDKERPPPTPDLLVPQFQKNLNIRSSRNNKEDKRKNKNTSLGGKIVYSNNSVSRWWVAGLGDDQFSSSVHLEPISLEEIERKYGEKPLVLVANHSIQGLCIYLPLQSYSVMLYCIPLCRLSYILYICYSILR